MSQNKHSELKQPHPGELRSDTERYQWAEIAAYRLLRKFHLETKCGKRNGDHWAECDALVDAFGWESWEAWQMIVNSSIS